MKRHVFLVCGPFFALALLAAALTAAEAEPKKPIPTGKDAYTYADFYRHQAEFGLEEVAMYKKHTKDPAAVRTAAVDFLTAVQRLRFHQQHKPTWQELVRRGKQLKDQGSTDPLVRLYLVWVNTELKTFKPVERQTKCKGIVADLKGTDYPARVKFHAIETLRRSFASPAANAGGPKNRGKKRKKGKGAKGPKASAFAPFGQQYVDWAVAYLAEMADRRDQERMVYNSFVQLLGGTEALPLKKRIIEAIEKEAGEKEAGEEPGRVGPWMREMIYGDYHFQFAWNARGPGVAGTVSPEGWRLYHEHLALAVPYFVKAWKIDPKNPVAAARMLNIASTNGRNVEPRRVWFDRCVAAQMDHISPYEYMRWFSRPRWGGCHHVMFEFARECLETERWDTEVPLHYVYTLLDIAEERRDKGDVLRLPGTYDSCKKVFAAIENEPAHADGTGNLKPRLQTIRAMIAIWAEDYDEARKVLDKAGDRFDMVLFQKYSRSVMLDMAPVYALTGDNSEEAREAHKLFASEGRRDPAKRQRALQLLTIAREKNTDPRAKPFFDRWCTILKWEHDFARGEWVNLTFAPKLHCWDKWVGQWKVESERAIVGTSLEPQRRGMCLMSLAKFPAPFEVQVDRETLERKMPSGLLVGPSFDWSTPEGGQPGRLFYINSTRCFCGVAIPGLPVAGPPYPFKKVNRLQVRVWPQHYEFYTNDMLIAVKREKNFDPRDMVGLANAHWLLGAPSFRFSNMRIRKITEPPPPAGEGNEALVEYYTKRIEKSPKEPRLYFARGLCYCNLKRFTEGVTDFGMVNKLAPENMGAWYFIAKIGATLKQYDYILTANRKLLEFNPNLPQAHNDIAKIMATCPDAQFRNGSKAVEHAQKACKQTNYRYWDFVETLAAAHAEAGQFELAIKWGKKALQLAPEDEKAKLQKQLKTYAARKAKKATK